MSSASSRFSTARTVFAVLTALALLAIGCKKDASARDGGATAPTSVSKPLRHAEQPLPEIRRGDDVAVALAKMSPRAPTGAPADESGRMAAIAKTVRTDPGDIPRLCIAHEGKKLELPLKHTHVRAEVSGFVARVEVTQTYRNPFAYPIEAVYVFPLPENSAVDDLKMVIGARVIEAEIQKREEARRTYEEAKRAGHTAALLEQERPNIFTQSVANIAPREDIDVVIRYVQDLTYDAGEYELVFPMVVGPRFIPGGAIGSSGTGWSRNTDEVQDASRITPPIVGAGMRSGHDISLELMLDPALEVVDFDAPTHRVDVVETDGRLLVTLADDDSMPNRDFVFRYRVAGDATKVALVAHREGEGPGTFALMLQPPDLDLDELVGRREMVFVVDVSGSMSGVPLALAKQAMREVLHRLRPVDTFNVMTFAGSTQRLFESPAAANATNLRQALRFVDGARAGGGTYLADAVQRALSPSAAQGRHRYVFFLTDGYVGNERAIFAAAEYLVDSMKERGQRARVFTLGTGSSVNRHLLSGLAKAGGGTMRVVTTREDPADAVDRIFGQVDHAVLTNVTIDWGGLPVDDLEPKQLPDLFASRPLILHGRYEGAAEASIVIRGRAGDRDIELPLQVRLPERETRHGALDTLWARARVDRLERDLWHSFDKSVVERITDLGLEFRLVTAWTSFVAVDRSRTVGSGAPRTIVQPVETPEDVAAEAAAPPHAIIGGISGAPPAPRAAHRVRAKAARARLSRKAAQMPASRPFASMGDGAGLSSRRRGQLKKKEQAPSPEPVTEEIEKSRDDEAKASSIRSGAPTIEGALESTAAARTLRKWARAFRRVYERALKANGPSFGGRVVFELSLEAGGRVSSAKVVENTTGSASFARQLLAVAKRFRFAASSDGRPVTLRCPFVFKPAR
jgi:Ca-activated chloride channel homolog